MGKEKSTCLACCALPTRIFTFHPLALLSTAAAAPPPLLPTKARVPCCVFPVPALTLDDDDVGSCALHFLFRALSLVATGTGGGVGPWGGQGSIFHCPFFGVDSRHPTTMAVCALVAHGHTCTSEVLISSSFVGQT